MFDLGSFCSATKSRRLPLNSRVSEKNPFSRELDTLRCQLGVSEILDRKSAYLGHAPLGANSPMGFIS
jgi:hypothetical protein